MDSKLKNSELKDFGQVAEPETVLAVASEEPEMRAHYSFKGGQRGRYAHLFPQEPHLVVLSPDVAAVFPDSDAVNAALRTLMGAAPASGQAAPKREQS